MLANFAPDDADKAFQRLSHQLPDEETRKALRAFADTQFSLNPIRYAWNRPTQGGNTTIQKIGSGSLRAALYTADLCGGYLLLGGDSYRRQYDIAVDREGKPNELSEMSRAFAGLRFTFLNAVTLDFALGLRKDGSLARLRGFLQKVWRDASSGELSRAQSQKEFVVRLQEEYEQYKREWAEISRRAGSDFVNAAITGSLAYLTGQIDYRVALGGVATFGLKALRDANAQRSQKQRLPLAVFLRLEERAGKLLRSLL